MQSVEDVEILQERIRRAPAALIAARIRRVRKAHGSHDALAAEIGSSRQHLIKLEQGAHRPRAPMLLKIAEATNTPVDFFLDEGTDDPFQEAA